MYDSSLRKALWHTLPSEIHINFAYSPSRQSIPPASQKRIGSILTGGGILGFHWNLFQ